MSAEGHKELYMEEIKTFYLLLGVMIIKVCTFVRTHYTAYLKMVNFTVCK